MSNKLKIKILGEDPSNLFLALLLLKEGFKVEIIKKDDISKKIRKERLFFISHSTKLILDNSNLWSQLEKKVYSLESFSIYDCLILKNLQFSFRDLCFNKINKKNYGWIINYSYISELLVNELSGFDCKFSNLKSELKSELIDTTHYLKPTINENSNKGFFIPELEKSNISTLEFTVSLRGYEDNRIYTILCECGFIVLFPINKNLFILRWFIKNSLLKRRLSFGNSFLLDNLQTILPQELKIDQIFGQINFIPSKTKLSNRLLKRKNLFMKKAPDKFIELGIEDLNLSFREVIIIYNRIKDANIKNLISYNFFKFKFLIYRTYNHKFFNIIYKLFINDNYFLNIFKKFIFNLIKKVKITKKVIFKLIILKF